MCEQLTPVEQVALGRAQNSQVVGVVSGRREPVDSRMEGGLWMSPSRAPGPLSVISCQAHWGLGMGPLHSWNHPMGSG